MAAKRAFVKRPQGKRSPTRSASWVLKRIDSWQRFHSSIPVKYKVPIVLISGYVVTLIIALILIGAILNMIIDQFETELQNKGFGGFAKLHSLNKSIHESSLADLFKINLILLPTIQEDAIKDLPNKFNELKKFIEDSDASYNYIVQGINTLSQELNQKANSPAFIGYKAKVAKLFEEIVASERSHAVINRLLVNKTLMEEQIFNMLLPVNSYHLQCGDQGPQQNGWNKYNAKWELMRSDQPKYLYLGPFNDSTATGPDIFDFISQLTIKLAAAGQPDFFLSPSSVTRYADGFAVQLSLREKMNYSPPSLVCGLWLRTG